MSHPPPAAAKPRRRRSATGLVIRGIVILFAVLWIWNLWQVRRINRLVQIAEGNGSAVAYHSSTMRKVLGFNILPTVGAPARVSLDGWQADPSWYGELRLLSDLNQLSLSRSNIEDIELRHLKGMHQLEDLRLSHTRISDAGLVHLAGLTSLRRSMCPTRR